MAGSFKVSGLPIRARLCRLASWQAKATGAHESITISRNELGETRICSNVWPLRERFLGLKTWNAAFEFFSEFGPFLREDEEVRKEKPSPEEVTTVDFATVREHQRIFKDFMEDEDWYVSEAVTFDQEFRAVALSRVLRTSALGGYPSPSFALKMGFAPIKGERVPSPFLDYEGDDIYRAIYASIYIDKMRGLRGGVCQREGCTNTFLTTDPRKRFCDAGPGRGNCSAIVRMQLKRRTERIAKGRETHG